MTQTGRGSDDAVMAQSLSVTPPKLPTVTSAVLSDTPNLSDSLQEPAVQQIMYKIIVIQGWLVRFNDEYVRRDFLGGKIVNQCPIEILTCLDQMSELLLPDPNSQVPQTALRGVDFIVGLLKKDDSQPCNAHGQSFPVKWTCKDWNAYLAKLSASSYWDHKARGAHTLYPVENKVGEASRKELQTTRLYGKTCHPRKKEGEVYKSDPSDASSDSSYRKGRSGKRRGRHEGRKGPKFNYESDSNGSLNGPPEGSDHLRAIISQLRHPKEPVEPLVFNGKDGSSIIEFLEEYEAYFKTKHDGSDRQQARMLRKYLAGPALRAYEALDGANTGYDELHMELIQWYKGVRRSQRTQNESKFRKAQMEPNESYKIYAIRLERLASKAFPHDIEDCRRNLCRKFKSSVSAHFKKVMNNAERSLAVTSKGKKNLNWHDMLNLAKAEDKVRRDAYEDTTTDVSDIGSSEVWHSRVDNTKDDYRKGPGPRQTVTFEATHRAPSRNLSHKPQPYQSPPVTRRTPPPDKPAVSQNYTTQPSPPPSPQGSPSARIFSANKTYQHLMCHWCGRRGHTEDRCWAKAGVCRRCGSVNHDTDGCGNESDTPTCSRCKGPHLGMNCNSKLND